MKPLVLEPDASMGNLLRCAEAQQQKSCDEDLGGCGSPNPVNHFLEGTPPRVFTLQVAWESHSEGPDVIASTLAALDEEVCQERVWLRCVKEWLCAEMVLACFILGTAGPQFLRLDTHTPSTGGPGRGVPGRTARPLPLPPAQHGVLLRPALPGDGAGA